MSKDRTASVYCCPPESVCFHPATHMDVLHIELMDMKLKRLRAKLSASYLDVWRTEPSTSNRTSTHTHTHTHAYTHAYAAIMSFHISCFPPASLLCATFHFYFQQQQACSAPVNRNFVVSFLPPTKIF